MEKTIKNHEDSHKIHIEITQYSHEIPKIRRTIHTVRCLISQMRESLGFRHVDAGALYGLSICLLEGLMGCRALALEGPGGHTIRKRVFFLPRYIYIEGPWKLCAPVV